MQQAAIHIHKPQLYQWHIQSHGSQMYMNSVPGPFTSPIKRHIEAAADFGAELYQLTYFPCHHAPKQHSERRQGHSYLSFRHGAIQHLAWKNKYECPYLLEKAAGGSLRACNLIWLLPVNKWKQNTEQAPSAPCCGMYLLKCTQSPAGARS